jgi:hypothetical protein
MNRKEAKMFVRVTRASYDKVDESVVQNMVRDELLPAMKKLPGFQHYHGGLDRASRRLVAISLWDTEEHSRALGSARAGFEAKGVKFEPAETFEITDSV